MGRKNYEARVNILNYIKHFDTPGDFKQIVIAKKTLTDQAYVSKILKEFKENGYILQHYGVYNLTEAGENHLNKMLKEGIPEHRTEMQILLDYLAGVYKKEPKLCCTDGLMMCNHDGTEKTCRKCLDVFVKDLKLFDSDPFSRKVKYGKQVKLDV